MGVEVATQSGVDQFPAHGRIADGEERQRLYDAQAVAALRLGDGVGVLTTPAVAGEAITAMSRGDRHEQ